MRNRTVSACLAAVVLALSGCGSSKTASTTAGTSSVTVRTATGGHRGPPKPPPKSATYSANLASAPGISPKRSGFAVITLNAPDEELCWTFSQLKNVKPPPTASIASHNIFVPLGRSYATAGCNVEMPPAFFRIIEANPHEFDVVISNAKDPEAAMRGPLSP
jgi:hypothetical protein